MSFTITGTKSTASTSNLSSYASGNFTALAGEYLIVFVVSTDTLATGTMTGSMTYTKITSTRFGATNANTVYAFISNEVPSSSSGHTATFSCAGDAATGALMFVIRIQPDYYPGAKYGLSAIKQYATTSGAAASTPTVTLGAVTDTNNPVLLFVGNLTNPATLNAGGGLTEMYDTGYNTPTTGGWVGFAPNGYTSSSVSAGSTSASYYGGIAIELDVTPAPTISTSSFFSFF